MFLLIELQKKTRTFILNSMMRGNSIIAFHRVSTITFTSPLSKTFVYWRNLKILISVKRRTFSINYYIQKAYLHKKLIYIQITKTNNKKIYFEKFIEELDFVEQATQVKHLRVCTLHDDWLNDSQRYYC